MPYAQIQVAATPGISTGLCKSKLGAIGLLAGCWSAVASRSSVTSSTTGCGSAPISSSVIDAPILGELPQDNDVKRGDVSIALVQAPQSSMAEALRDLRTSLRVLLVDQQSPVLVVTSPEAGDGKTFVTANLAASWALTGSRVIVVSADFRRPRLEEAFGIDAAESPGLSDLIKANWKQAEPSDGPTNPTPDTATRRETSGRRPGRHAIDARRDGGQCLPPRDRDRRPPAAAGRCPP